MEPQEVAGMADEFAFWSEFVKTDTFVKEWIGDASPRRRMPQIDDFVKSVEHDRVLDVGSGPVSILRGLVPEPSLTACDPMSPFYELLIDYEALGITPPDPYPGEELPYSSEFDVVHMSNALDHTQDPELVMACLERAATPGGWVLIQTWEREATCQRRIGFHQWDATLWDRELVLENQTRRIAFTGDRAERIEHEGRWLVVWAKCL